MGLRSLYCLVVAAFAFVLGMGAQRYGVFQDLKLAILPTAVVTQLENRGLEYESRAQFFRGSEAQADIVMLGDSITEFADWRELLPQRSILNRGIRGDTANGVLARLDEVKARHPKTVFLMIGVNDLFRGRSPQDVFESTKKIVYSLAQSHIGTVVEGVLPTQSDDKINDSVRVLDGLLQGWCASSGIGYLSIADRLTSNGRLRAEYTYDGLHLNGNAYLIWRDAVDLYLQLNPPGAGARALSAH